jgi:hypothetical protein
LVLPHAVERMALLDQLVLKDLLELLVLLG